MTEEQQKILSDTQRLIGILYRKLGAEIWMDTRTSFAQILGSKYGIVECQNYHLFHIMLGGSPGETSFFDFPEPDSIHTWLMSQLNPTE